MNEEQIPKGKIAEPKRAHRGGADIGWADAPMRVMLVEDHIAYRHLLRDILDRPGLPAYRFVEVNCLAEAITEIEAQPPHLIVLDLALPDCQGIKTLRKLRGAAPDIPIVVLTGMDDEELGMQAVQEGAQDYLVKGPQNTHQLPRALRYALERHRLKAEVEAQSITDELTGLYNRRGFFAMARRQFDLAQRKGASLLVLYADLDGLKEINDKLSHAEGNHAILEASTLLREAFRATDIVARLGGDEFTVMAIDANERCAAELPMRLATMMNARNKRPGRSFLLSMSIGCAVLKPGAPVGLEEILSQADRAMYACKKTRREAGIPVIVPRNASAAKETAEAPEAIPAGGRQFVPDEPGNRGASTVPGKVTHWRGRVV
jgi:diguanylate cyclase (GGDEF)-like protein